MATYSGSDKRIKYLFENGGGGGGSSTLAGLSDVNLSSPSDGQVLTYDNGEWVNAAGGSSGMCYLNTMYSTTERKIGYLEDGKPLYQLSVVLPSQEIINSNAWYTTSISNANIEKIPYARGMNDEGTSFPLMANCDATGSGVNYVQIGNPRAAAISVKEFVIQYTKTTDTAETNPQQGGVIYLPAIYSEEEREVGVWTDGKPLYQKTFIFHSSDVSGNEINETITEPIDTCVSVTGFVDRIYPQNNKLTYPVNCFEDTRYYCFARYSDVSSSITYKVKFDSVDQTTIQAITLQYTKTTDTPGSGTWTPSGAPAVHYSTNEQVVGTWIDGKTIYQKTVAVTANIPYNNWSNTGVVVDPNADRVITIPQARPQSGSSDMCFLAYFETGGVLCVMNMRNVNYGDNYAFYITIQYTKSS